MAVTVVRPTDWTTAEMVEVESDARDNYHAIAEIEDWANDHGRLRTNENYLSTALVSGRKVFRAICYRPTAEQIAAREARIRDGHRLAGLGEGHI